MPISLNFPFSWHFWKLTYQPQIQAPHEPNERAHSFTRCLRSTKEFNQFFALCRGHNSSASRNACDHKLSWKSAKDWAQRVIVQTNGASICPHPAFNERAAIGEGSEWGMGPNHRITRDTSRYKPTLGCLWPITNKMQYKYAVCDQSVHSWTIARPDEIVGDSRTDLSRNYWGTLVMANLNPRYTKCLWLIRDPPLVCTSCKIGIIEACRTHEFLQLLSHLFVEITIHPTLLVWCWYQFIDRTKIQIWLYCKKNSI